MFDRKVFIIISTIAFFMTCSYATFAAPGGPDSPNEKFSAGDMIMHHITDTHEWHVLDWKSNPVSIPLPIILLDDGLHIFMSSKFNHGKSIIERGGKYYKLYHGNKIYHTDQLGTINYDNKNEVINTSPLDLSITKNVFSLLLTIIILLIVFFRASRAYKKDVNSAPKGLRGALEILILFVRDDIAKPAIGTKHYNSYLPFLLTVFFFILLSNLMGLVPVFPGGANLTGNIAIPLVLAGMVFIITTLSGKKTYWKHIFAMPGVPIPVLLILTPIEILGALLKPIVLMIRLFANITAGHIIVLSFFSFIFIFGEISPVAGYGASIMSITFSVFMTILEILVAFLQAYVFTLLSAIYFGSAVEEEH